MPDKQGDVTRILHIIDAIEELKEYTTNLKFEDFKNQSIMIHASIRLLVIIGEASNHISEEIKNENPQIEWAQIIGLRNILIHKYFGVDVQVVWDIINRDLVDLELKVKAILIDLQM